MNNQEHEVKAEYIRSIEIDALWGRKHIVWNLRPDVNILSGVNGVGKSTILNNAAAKLDYLSGGEMVKNEMPGVKVAFFPENATSIHFDVIRSFDRPLFHSSLLEKLADKNVKTELDWQLYQLQRRYLDYQVNIGNRMIALLSKGDSESQMKATQLSVPKRHFQDLIDELFSDTGKTIIRTSNEIMFLQGDETLLPYRLSSGEKQMLVILLTVLVQDEQPCVLLMDEPEISLHVEWQQRIIRLIREMNPHVQVILTTHSPAVVMGGWMDAVTEVNDITQ